MYDTDAHLRVPLDESRLKVLRGNLRPRDLKQRLTGEALQLRLDFAHTIERSEAQLERMLVEDKLPAYKAYWDERLRTDKDTRVRLFLFASSGVWIVDRQLGAAAGGVQRVGGRAREATTRAEEELAGAQACGQRPLRTSAAVLCAGSGT